ncbi:MAG: DUF1330 domain-containing protein [Alphaproteobacteria bacterium]
MPSYIIYETTITDDSWRVEYGEKVGPLLAKHGGKVIVRDRAPARIEGSRSLPSVVVVIEFPTRAAAEAWHNDPAYKPLHELRNTGSSAEVVLVDNL